MTDRVPLYPGRITLTPVSGQTNTYDMAMADQPQVDGTPLNKSTFLKDATASLLSLSGDPTVDDALNALINGKATIASGSYVGTGTFGSSTPTTVNVGMPFKVFWVSCSSGYIRMLGSYCVGDYFFFTHSALSSISNARNQIVTLSGNTISWYSDGGNAEYQMNASDKTYNWYAIG